MYIIKQVPEDFVVEELYNLKFEDVGRYSYFRLKKRDYTTVKAIGVIARMLRIRPKFINFAGTKDKNAITFQNISISKGPRKNYHLRDISLKFLGLGNERLNLGCLDMNRFTITVRNLEVLPDRSLLIHKNYILNLFDDQRFGREKNNHIIGMHIINKEFDKACSLLDLTPKSKNDYIGALRTIPKKILSMYVHAYQSKLWNAAALSLFKKGVNDTDINIPIIGFMTEDLSFYDGILVDFSTDDFRMPQIPELFLEGSTRKMFVELTNLNISCLEDDDLNEGMKKCIVSFSLPKGAYATYAVKTLFHNI